MPTLKSLTIDGTKFEVKENSKYEVYEFLVTNDNPRVSVYTFGSFKEIQLDVTGLDKKSICFLFPVPTANTASKNKTLNMTSATNVSISLYTPNFTTDRPIFFIDQFIFDVGIQVKEGITYSGEPVFLSNQSSVTLTFSNVGIIDSSNNGVERTYDLSFNREVITQNNATFFSYPYFFRQGTFVNGFITAAMTEF